MGINFDTNPTELVELQYNPYQMAFLEARRARACEAGCTQDGIRLVWSMLEGALCPKCQAKGMRIYRRFMLRAGRRGGKTRIGGLSAVEECTVPHSIGWACAPSYPELHDYVLPAFFAQLPREWFEHPSTEWSKDRLSLVLPNKAQVHFRSLDDPNRGAGPGLDWLWIDEGRKIQELAWQLIRPTLTERKGIAWITSTPDWGEDWCHRNFYEPAEQGRPGYWAVSYKTIDNPIIDPAQVEADRLTMPPELFRREYEASIEYPTGTIYGEAFEQCISDDDRIRQWIPEWPNVDPSRQSIVGIDPGTDHPFAGVLFIVTAFGLVWAGEYEQRNATFFKHQQGLKLMVGMLTPRWGIDRSQAQAALELSQYGIYAQGAENSVDAGIQRMYAWMASGRMRVSKSKCPKSIKAMRAYRWANLDETKKGIPGDAQPFKKDDDIPDAARYAVMLWPELPKVSDTDATDPRIRNLALLKPADRRLIERNLVKGETDDGLVRVTDDFLVADASVQPHDGASLSDFYV